MGNRRKRFRIGISGSYGGLNLGDEAILRVIVRQLRESLPVEITVFSRNPADTLKRHGVEHAVPVRDMSKAEVLPEVERLDLFILGGGGILFDAEVPIYLREMALAQEVGIPTMTYAVSAGPLNDPAARRLVRTCLDRADLVTVRERRAGHLLEQIGVSAEIKITADPAMLLDPEPIDENEVLRAEGLAGIKHLIGVSVREPGVAAPDLENNGYHELLANAADYMVDRQDAFLVFVPMERLDIQHSHAVIAGMARADRATVLKGEYSSGQMLSLMKRFDFAVGMRLHFLIFAAVQGVPFVALPYASKVGGFLEDMNIAMPPMKHVNAGQLIAYIDRNWDVRRDLKQEMAKMVPLLKERALQTNLMAVELVKRRAGDRVESPREAVR